ncbi:hypothetical protein [Bacillus cereus]|uniref:hypothetical protein n=1 Tax=Bacillus cereus TaxID=1396 RepID=UPI000BF495B2|nr:hypothetical protein [Bacillus cereus]PFF63996.1 hypothetical protein CN350_01350 [Bacillus cereus]PFL15287.1 hypothetical protein COJ24_04490 [Bacillus cereus]PFQ03542.1 hypothetical protein COK14_30210 [Bacillus cereus]PGR00984.1 hypothetical protein COA24_11240 [Bacillus cereus]
MDAKLQDRQLKYALKNHILPEKKFDFNEFRTQEEFNDFQEGLNKFNALSEDEQKELFLSIRNGTYEL